MIFLAFAAALAAAIAALAFNARRYVRWANAKWPPQGRFIEAEDATLHVREAGPDGGPRILLIHGASSNLLELWGPLANEFSPLHRVIAYDRPGMGHSTRARRDAHTLASQARCAARVLQATGNGPALIVAHSLGSAVALRLALDHPKLVRGLVLIAPACNPYPGKNAWWARLSATPVLGDLFCGLVVPWLAPVMAQASVANNFWPAATPVNYADEAGLGLIFRPRAFQASAQDVCATNAEFASQAPRYVELFTPAVIITAEKDKIVSPKRHARTLAAVLPAAELVIAPDTGHMPHRLRTDLVVAAIRRVNEMASAPAEG
ncbi:MAG TPA: alpha/beta hydrolase [Vitreimonas sp.]|jgi:pimeloyl-ACP methyl ester carboxylesterase|nr:alpha/beta hydrolase [Vitreimonas sp.]